MMRGGSKSIGSRNSNTGDHELEDYFAELDDGHSEPHRNTPTNVDPFAENSDIWFEQRRELRRLAAYAAHLKHEISTFSQMSQRTDEAVRPTTTGFPIIRSVVAAVTVAAVGLVTYRMLERR